MRNIKIFLYKILKFVFILPNKKKYFLVKKNSDYLILENLNELKEISKISLSNFEKNKNKIYSFVNKEKKTAQNYVFDITHFIDGFSKNKIDKFLSSQNILNNISDEFNLNVSFDHFTMRLNIFNSNSPEEFGPKMWHRDNDAVFGQLKFFFILNNLNSDDGGLFYFIPKKYIPDFYKLSSKYLGNEKTNPYHLNRIKNYDIMNKYKLEDKIISFGTKNNEALILDTNDTYHKGGYIKNKDSIRIMIQAIYKCNKFSFNIYDKRYNNNIFYNKSKIYLNGLKNRLRVYL